MKKIHEIQLSLVQSDVYNLNPLNSSTFPSYVTALSHPHKVNTHSFTAHKPPQHVYVVSMDR